MHRRKMQPSPSIGRPSPSANERFIISWRGIGRIAPLPEQGSIPGITVDLLREMVDETVENGSSRENTNGRPGRIYEYDFGHPIGIKINGRPAYLLRVVVNDRNELVTAFPF